MGAPSIARLVALNPLAQAEGWDIFECDNGELQLQAIDESDIFTGWNRERDAWAHVCSKAKEGSALHMEALAILREHSPAEYQRIMDARG